jgi:hypothetical protein
MMRTAAYVCAVLLLLGPAAGADPNPVIYSGGSLKLLDDHPTVSLVSERLLIEPGLITSQVTVDLEFRNEGPAREVQMAFPIAEFREPGYRSIQGFLADLDGEPLAVSRGQRAVGFKLRDGLLQCTWDTFAVSFEENQTRHLRVRYDEASRVQAMLDRVRSGYVLATGANWKGPLRDFQLEVRLGDRLNFHEVSVTGDEQELPVALRGDSLFWQTSDYDGDPAILWFRATNGPASLTINDQEHENSPWTASPVMWRRGHLLIASDLLRDLTGLAALREGVNWAAMERGRQTAHPQGWQMPAGPDAGYKLYLDPAQALEKFGGAIEVRRDQAGDAHVRIDAPLYTEDSARLAALDRSRPSALRQACLDRLSQGRKRDLTPVLDELKARTGEDPGVVLWVLGARMVARREARSGEEVLQQMQFAAGSSPEQQLAEVVLASDADEVVLGATRLLPLLDAEAARGALISGILPRARYRARNAGLALRSLGAGEAVAEINAAFEREEAPGGAPALLLALGFLGDDAAVDGLKQLAVTERSGGRSLQREAALALSYLGTEAALAACVHLATGADDSLVRSWAQRGIAMAIGAEYTEHRDLPDPAPRWARAMSEANASQVVLPLLEAALERQPASRRHELYQLLQHVQKRVAPL